jgi:hypothetical protein
MLFLACTSATLRLNCLLSRSIANPACFCGKRSNQKALQSCYPTCCCYLFLTSIPYAYMFDLDLVICLSSCWKLVMTLIKSATLRSTVEKQRESHQNETGVWGKPVAMTPRKRSDASMQSHKSLGPNCVAYTVSYQHTYNKYASSVYG